MEKVNKIKVQGFEIEVISDNHEEYISLTDMIRAKDGEFFISDWVRNRNTLEFIGIWEKINNPFFNYGEFAIIKSQAGLNSFKISIKDLVKRTGVIGLKSATGRYGGTFAHKDIAFEFGLWISPEFKLYLIKEFQRLKNEENEKLSLDWDAKRMLTKINYKIHTDAISKNIILPLKLLEKDTNKIYASEADVLNKALFGLTALEWRNKNKTKTGNMRDYADVTQLVCLANLESINAEFIKMSLSQKERLIKLNETAITQMGLLLENKNVKKLLK